MNTDVTDRFGVTADEQMPFLALALEPKGVERRLARALAGFWGECQARLKAIRVTRYLPGRRCVVEYDLDRLSADGVAEPTTVIVSGERLYLLDFDLYCVGDPGLDVGNFIGHLTVQSLRETGDPTALAAVEEVLEERFVELEGGSCRRAVHAYTILTLARHVYLSTQFPEPNSPTEPLLDLCERRLGLAPAAREGPFRTRSLASVRRGRAATTRPANNPPERVATTGPPRGP